MLSQDEDGAEVVWHDQAAMRRQDLAELGAQRPGGRDLRRFLISAAGRSSSEHKTRDEDRLLEELVSCPTKPRGAGEAGGPHRAEAAAAASPSAAPLLPRSAERAGSPGTTPFAKGPRRRRRRGLQSVEKEATPGSARMSSGKRRKAFLDILDEVENLVSSGASSACGGAVLHDAASRLARGNHGASRTPASLSRASAHVGCSGMPQPVTGAGDGTARGEKAAEQSIEELCADLMAKSPAPCIGPSDLFRGYGPEGGGNQGPAGTSEGGAESKGRAGCRQALSAPLSEGAAAADGPPRSIARVGGACTREEALPGEAHLRTYLAGSREEVRHVVLEAWDETDAGKTVRLWNEFKGAEVEVHLSDYWADTAIAPGDTLNLLADVQESGGRRVARVDGSSGLIITHPDFLISGTRVTSACKCTRQAAIEELFACDGGSNEKALLGTLVHRLFQCALSPSSCQLGAEDLHKEVDGIIAQSLLPIFEVGLEESAVRAKLRETVPVILEWRKLFCQQEPDRDAVVDMGPKGGSAGGLDAQRVAVTEILDIEESIWSPRFGLKGMIDVSARVRMEDVHGAAVPTSATATPGAKGPRVFRGKPACPRIQGRALQAVAPLELKTGRSFHGHRAQVALYMLLMSDRYTAEVSTGLLWYIHEAKPQGVQFVQAEIASLLQQRNRLAAHLAKSAEGSELSLPPVLRNPQACLSCFQLEACMLLHKGLEGGTSETSGIGHRFDELVGHVRPQHSGFVRRWMRLVQAESRGAALRQADVWASTSRQRESAGGLCLGGLRLARHQPRGARAELPDEEGCHYAFELPEAGERARRQPLSPGDRVLLSIEGEHVAVGRGRILSAGADSIEVCLLRPLHRRLLAAGRRRGSTWRLDADEPASAGSSLRGNLLRLLQRDGERSDRLRRLLTEDEPPVFDELVPPEVDKYLSEKSREMNAEQAEAVRKVVEASDYALILGMPGTGKTATICHIVSALAAAGLSVLVTAYTNSAVDNVLLRLKRENAVEFLRLGGRGGVHSDLKEHCLGSVRFPCESVDQIRRMVEALQVIGTTCLGVGHTLIQAKRFDVVIVDEASQLTLPASLGALAKASKFVLVGDHYQLPPLVVDEQASQGGLAVSIFETLAEAHPVACTVLSRQYRMCKPIMGLANELVYSGRMKCGCQRVAGARLALSSGQQPDGGCPQWLQKVLDPSQALVFIDTARQTPEAPAGSSLCNLGEAAIVSECLERLLGCGADASSLAVISPYRAQVNTISKTVGPSNTASGIEVLTIDRSQGRDKSCVIISLVRSNAQRSPGELLTDWRRINVALTRAQHKLILIGCASTLSSIPFFSEILDAAARDGWLCAWQTP